jgi:hypothetical protein
MYSLEFRARNKATLPIEIHLSSAMPSNQELRVGVPLQIKATDLVCGGFVEYAGGSFPGLTAVGRIVRV